MHQKPVGTQGIGPERRAPSSAGFSRRTLLHAGLGAVGLGLLRLDALRAPFAGAASVNPPRIPPGPLSGTSAYAPASGFPIRDLAPELSSIIVDGLPFAEGWTGDGFSNDDLPFHACENCFPNGAPPEPQEEVEIAIIGGGLSGLAAAYALRDRRIVLLEMREQMGGAAAGERWRGTACSLGSAYFIVPDPGSELEALYREIGVWPGAAVSKGELSVEIAGRFVPDLLEWEGFSPRERAIVRRYADAVRFFGDEYPEIPLPRDRDVRWILDLDRTSLRDDIEQRVGAALPQRLAEGVQAYCYSSFGVGWEEISAAAGWNFIAAEEFGRIVLPGGNAGLAAALWRSLHAAEVSQGRSILRAGRKVVDVRLDGDGVLVTRREGDGFASLRARHVVMANAKFVAKWMLPDLHRLDPEKLDAMHQAGSCAYAVVNLLMERSAAQRFYDVFLLGDKGFPMGRDAAEQAVKVIDVLDGGYGGEEGIGGSTILTLYWPLPWHAARFTLITPQAWNTYAELLAPQVRAILDLLGIEHRSIHQIRMSRWGHAMPIAKPNAIANGLPELLRRPLADRIWFVNQDNWLLPAVETCLLEALHFAQEIRGRL